MDVSTSPENRIQSVVINTTRALSHWRPRDEGLSLTAWLRKADNDSAVSSQKGDPLRIDRPIDVSRAKDVKRINVHHSACIEAKKACTVGLGFITEEDKLRRKMTEMSALPFPPEFNADGTPKPHPVLSVWAQLEEVRDQPSKAATALDGLCRHTLQNLMADIAEDFWSVGWGLIEVTRNAITGEVEMLTHAPAEDFWIVDEGNGRDFHWISCIPNGDELRYAEWGDTDRLWATELPTDGGEAVIAGSDEAGDRGEFDHEIIFIPRASSLHRHYSLADWLAAARDIELKEALDQKTFDYFNNRGIPELALFITGGSVDPRDLTTITDGLKSATGVGNAYKSIVANLPAPELKIQLERLTQESPAGDEFAEMTVSFALQIVTAHGVPPLLAGIQVPGKMGAANELPNALLGFQELKIGPAQREITAILGRTLGSQEAGLDLKPADFVLNNILERFNLGAVDTMSRMRQPVVEAQAQGRKPEDGLKED